MEITPDATIREALGKMIDNLANDIRVDLSTKSIVRKRRNLKKHMSLFCLPRPVIIGAPPETKLTASAGEYFPQTTFDERFLREFLDEFMNRDREVSNANGLIADRFGGTKGAKLLAELYLLVFCYSVTREILSAKPSQQVWKDDFIDRFVIDLKEEGLRVCLRAGLNGIGVSNEITFKPSPDADILIRPPILADYAQPVMIVEHWDGDYDYASSPSFPEITSFIELELKRLIFAPLGTMIVDPRLYDTNRTVDWLANGIISRMYEARTVLALFQSKGFPHFQSLALSLTLKNMSRYGGNYDVTIGTTPTSLANPPQFLITAEKEEQLKAFWKRMLAIKMIDRIYGRHKRGTSPLNHVAKPTEVAFTRYMTTFDSWDSTEIKIHDIVETLEGFFTPEKHVTKRFIPRVAQLMTLLNVDPTSAKSVLEDGWEIRSIYTHHATGWYENKWVEYARNPAEEMQIIRFNLENRFRNTLAEVLLNYLRVCLVCRILSGLTDMSFIERLDPPGNGNKSKQTLGDLRPLLDADRLETVKRAPTVKCPDCSRQVPEFAMHIHKESECTNKKTDNH